MYINLTKYVYTSKKIHFVTDSISILMSGGMWVSNSGVQN